MINVKLKGKNDTHVKFMSRSYRIRGIVPRTVINIIIKTNLNVIRSPIDRAMLLIL